MTSSSCNSSIDSSSSQHHPYAYTNMAVATTNKISNTTTNLVVDSTSHLPEIINVPSSSIIESSSTCNSNNNNNNHTQQLSPNELINNDNVR